MTHNSAASWGTFFGTVAFAALASISVGGQGRAVPQTAGSKPWTVSKTPDGVPDLRGMWVYFDSTPFETPGVPTRRRVGESAENAGAAEARQAAEFAANRTAAPAGGAAAAGGGGGGGDGDLGGFADRKPVVPKRRALVVAPANGHVPIKPSAVEYNDFLTDHFYDSYAYQNSAERCITRGIPGVAFPNGYNSAIEITQSPGYVVIIYEMFHEARVIPLDGSPHLPPHVRLWQGDSRGHWEGDTLVVDVTNYTDKGSPTPNAGSGHLRSHRQSEALHVIERFTPVGPETINYEVTVADPNIYTEPWTVALPLTRDQTYKIYEYACHEGNYNYMTNVLRAGRVQDSGSAAVSESRKAAEEARKAPPGR